MLTHCLQQSQFTKFNQHWNMLNVKVNFYPLTTFNYEWLVYWQYWVHTAVDVTLFLTVCWFLFVISLLSFWTIFIYIPNYVHGSLSIWSSFSSYGHLFSFFSFVSPQCSFLSQAVFNLKYSPVLDCLFKDVSILYILFCYPFHLKNFWRLLSTVEISL